jgi:radical SAM superfamily enzyme YgiQ (UPF0313 family)
MKLLLTSVFGPYAVDDAYGEKENNMELFHNQVTREQGIFSYRFNHGSQGLPFLAANIDVPTTVLDFPTFARFHAEVKKGYDYIGISFIVPNLEKARKMAATIRETAPKTRIILGGHGVSTPGVETLIDHDHICRGEGVGFLRRLFRENVTKPINHPLEYSSFNRQVMGVPWAPDSGILITGLGCANRCRFCATSHFFGSYIPLLKTGREIFDVCCRYESEKKITDFGVLDENFLKTKDRALDLLALMEKHQKHFTFSIFSSAETLQDIGDLDILVRLGVTFIWIGVESKKAIYAKNKGTDFTLLVKELRRRGISVMASSILFTEDHDKTSIWEDVDFATALNADYLQFMQLGPMPGTTLYADFEKAGRLLPDLPHAAKHGQGMIWFHHDHFTREESKDYLRLAFEIDYNRNGASMLRAVKTGLDGYAYCNGHADPQVRARANGHRIRLAKMRYFLLASRLFVQNRQSEALLQQINALFRHHFGRKSLLTIAASLIVVAFAVKEYLRCRLIGDVRVPATSCRSFNGAGQKMPRYAPCASVAAGAASQPTV